MRKTWKGAAAVALGLLTACGSGGGGSSTGGSGSQGQLTGMLELSSHAPGDGAVQVPLQAEMRLEFDAILALECLQDEDTWLRPSAGGNHVPGTFSPQGSGRTVVFRPSAPLQPETDYTFQLSPLTCDRDGRILERTVQIHFRTFDATPPVVTTANVPAGAQGVSRTAPLLVRFSEALLPDSVRPTSVQLRDVFGQYYSLALVLDGDQLTATPVADLPGDRNFVFAVLGGVQGVQDRAGNALAQNWPLAFRTAQDTTQPWVTAVWPAPDSTGISPAIQPEITFSESVDPASIEPSSLLFLDEFGTLIPYKIHPSADQRRLRIQPHQNLPTGRLHTIAFVLGPAAVTDVSGNPLATTTALVFRTGSDAQPPVVYESMPTPGAIRVSPNVIPTVAFSEPLDPAFVGPERIALLHGTTPLHAVVELVGGGTVLRVTPVLLLPTGAQCSVVVRGGPEGIRDLAGNLLSGDQDIAFTTSSDATPPQLILLPGDGTNAVPTGIRMVAAFDSALDPATVHGGSVQLFDENNQPVPGAIGLQGAHRIVTFTPAAALRPFHRYRLWLLGGPDGVREVSGNWLFQDAASSFRTGSGTDGTPPTVRLTLNSVDDTRKSGMVLPPSGFTIDVEASDPVGRSLDIGSFRLQLEGPGAGPDADALYASAVLGYQDLHYRLPGDRALAAGAYTLTARVRDLSGNEAVSAPLNFDVRVTGNAVLPFERTQVVWVRTDLDRDGNGRADFDDDLLRLGLQTAGDPLGQNARMRRLVLDGIFVQVYRLLGRGPRGEILGADSVALRLTSRQPIGVPHMQMALGGLDPEGDRNRGYGDPSTGILGRAYYDARNSNLTERNIAARPGLGVFPSEMFLYQARIHIQVFPSFQTLFAQRFLPLCPEMGGTPAGAHVQDSAVLDPAFSWSAATSGQRARWTQVFEAADDWAAVIGVILAHENGHSIGLTAPGNSPLGLFGDSSFHNQLSGAAEVMAPAVGYEAMVTLPYAFRDVNLAYLRQRLLLP